jgi:isoleucyl-tRNA synthetase
MLATWYEGLVAGSDEDNDFWQRLREVRELVGPKLEELRRSKAIGSSLAAEITLDARGELAEALAAIGDELRFVFLSSDVHLGPIDEAMGEAEIGGELLRFQVRATGHGKCVRCWHHRDSVGASADHPELCGRCVENVDGPGETRRWA